MLLTHNLHIVHVFNTINTMIAVIIIDLLDLNIYISTNNFLLQYQGPFNQTNRSDYHFNCHPIYPTLVPSSHTIILAYKTPLPPRIPFLFRVMCQTSNDFVHNPHRLYSPKVMCCMCK